MNYWSFPFLLAHLVAATPVLANVVGNDSQTFNPVAGASDFVTVQSAGVLAPGHLNVGLFLDDATNTLPYKDENHGHINDSVMGMTMGVGYGLLPGLELGLALPFVTRQTVDDPSTRGEFAATGNTAVRGGIKWSFLRRAGFGLALITSATIDRVQDDPTAGTTANATTYNGEVAADWHLGRTTLALNLGYRQRSVGTALEGSLIGPLGDQWLASVAANYKITPYTALVGETYSDHPLKHTNNDSDRSLAATEALLGVRHNFTEALTGHTGLSKGIGFGLGAPDWRIYAGLVAELGPAASGAPKPSIADGRGVRTGDTPEAVKAAPELSNAEALTRIPAGTPDKVFVLHNINFAFDSDYRVLPGAMAELQKVNEHLAEHPGAWLVVEGHCDYFGTDAYNDDLSMRRARSVRHQLIKHQHLTPDNIVAVGYGKRQPMTRDTSDNGRQQNRRVEIKIYYDKTAHH